MTTSDPLVSVVTPVYNGAEFLAECIESVLSQTHRHFEYIIVNNCSTDRTLQVAQSYAARDERIRVHDNVDFLGVIENHNLAFSLTSPASKYCKVVSADDFIMPECLTRMVELAETHPSVAMVGAYMMAGRRVVNTGLEYAQQVVGGRQICRDTLMGGPYVFGSPTSLLYRADLLKRTKAFYPNSNPHSDTTAIYEALQTFDFGFVHQVLSFARIHAASQTSRSKKFGVINLAMVADLARFGPVYLDKGEFQMRLDHMLDQYYGWLAPAIFEHSGDKEFWRLQRSGLAEIGMQLSRGRLFKAVVRKGFSALLKPGKAVSQLMVNKGKAGEIQAQYYE